MTTTPKWLQDVMDKSSAASGRAKSRSNAPTKKELQKAKDEAIEYLQYIGSAMIPATLIGTKIGQQLAKGYGKAIGSGIVNTLQRGGSSRITKDIPRKQNLKNPFNREHYEGGDPRKPGYETLPVMMSPDQYLKLAGRVNLKTPQKQKKIKEMARVMSGAAKGKAGKRREEYFEVRTAPQFMVMPTKEGLQIGGHEGRHRAAAAKLLGIKKIPVTLKFYDQPKHLLSKGQKMELLGERNSVAQRFKRRYGKKK
jgi:hypothetical protein